MSKYTISMDIDAHYSLTRQEIEDFVVSELKCAGGNLRPEDPLFNGLTVSRFKMVRTTLKVVA